MSMSHLPVNWPAVFALSLTALAPMVQADVVPPGETVDLGPGDPVESWTLGTGATLNVNGATTQAINATSSVTLNVNAGSTTGSIQLSGSGADARITGSTIVGESGAASGFGITSGTADIRDSHISNDGVGMALARFSGQSGAVVSMTGGSVTGGTGGVTVSNGSELTLDGVSVRGTSSASYGLRAFNADVTARNSSISGGLNGIQYQGNPGSSNLGTLVLDNTQVQGQSGAALLVSGQFSPGTRTRVELRNGSTLEGGNGNALEVDNDANADVLVSASRLTGNFAVSNGSSGQFAFDNASLTGDITADASSTGTLALANSSHLKGNVSNLSSVTLDGSSLEGDIGVTDGRDARVQLSNGSLFTGRLQGVQDMAIESGSEWKLIDNQQVENLSFDQGKVRFGDAGQFYTLTVDNLSGNGTFVMDVDWASNQHDVLDVTGTATGSHVLAVAGSGLDPRDPQALTLVQAAAGDASFNLAGDQPVDVGTYSYKLGSRSDGTGGTEWFLDPESKSVSPGTRSVLALFNTAPTVWYGELTSLRSRMGEMRFNGAKPGAWTRAYSNKYSVSGMSGVGYDQVQSGFSLGADAPLPWGDGQWLVGVLAGHSRSDLDLTRGSSGTVDSYYAGLYTTWLDQASGYYFDAVLKANRFHNKAKVSMSDATRAKGDYDATGLGGSVEFGRHITLADNWFVEPYGQLSAVVIEGKDYDLNNGMRAEGDQTRSLLGKVGSVVGRNLQLANGTQVQPYVKVAVAHEFAKANRVQVNDNLFNNDLSGSRGEFGAGVAVAFSQAFSVHAEIDGMKGQDIEQPYGVNVGLRYSF
ncbi:autotransporter outer membrane beta-barrel domain-containing protein [Pseudomonas sp. TE21394]